MDVVTTGDAIVRTKCLDIKTKHFFATEWEEAIKIAFQSPIDRRDEQVLYLIF